MSSSRHLLRATLVLNRQLSSRSAAAATSLRANRTPSFSHGEGPSSRRNRRPVDHGRHRRTKTPKHSKIATYGSNSKARVGVKGKTNGGVLRYNAATSAFAEKLKSLAASPKPSGAREAQELLNGLVRRIDSGKERENVTLNVVLYTIVMNGWSRRGQGEEAQRLLERMEERLRRRRRGGRYNDDGGDGGAVRPDAYLYNAVIAAWAKTPGDPKSAERAERILDEMCQGGSGWHRGVRADEFSFGTVIAAWSRTGQKGSGGKALSLLARMEEEHDIRPNNIVMSSVIHALAKSGDKKGAERAEHILLNRMRHPDTIAFNSVLNAWAKSKEKGAAERAQSLLTRMEELHRRGSRHVRPNTISYTSVIHAYSNSGEEGSAAKAEQTLDRMMERQHAADDASAIDSNDDVRPDTIAFASVLNAWARSGEKGCAERAEAILCRMEALQKEGRDGTSDNNRSCNGIKLRTSLFNSCINAWANSGEKGCAERAEAILKRMEERADLNGDDGCAPNIVSYRMVMRAWSENGGKGHGKKVKSLHGRMKERGLV